MALFIMALLMAAAMPAIQTAFTENAVRNDSHQLSLMVKTAMIQSRDQHRPYVIELTSTNMMLHPVVAPAPETEAVAAVDKAPGEDIPAVQPEDVEIASKLDGANKLLTIDPDKPKVWMPMPETTWIFRPGDLCPAPRVRLSRGNAWLEMSFNALTGNVEDESTYFP